MTVAFDNTFLTLVLNPFAVPTPNPATGAPIPHCRQRIEALIDQLSGKNQRVLIPAPTLAEALVIAPDIVKVIAVLRQHVAMEIAPFDARSAIELGEITRSAIVSRAKKSGVEAPWQQVKFDRQIVAIAKAHGASILFTDDGPQTRFAELAGLTVKHTWDLELPDEYAQTHMFDGDQG